MTNIQIMDISYLITIFNKENEIQETIYSIKNQQKIDSLNVEIICIDDLSDDNSIQILENLQKEDPRIKVIKNDINLGPSISINIAAKQAKGKYLIPIDGDDFLPVDATRYLFDNAKIELGNNKSFTIKNINNSQKNIYIQSVELNWVDYKNAYITHKDIIKGGEIEFKMGPNPNKDFGNENIYRPKSKLY